MFEFLPSALEYGMELDTFWYMDEDYFQIYQKAYYKRLSMEKWVEGKYTLDAIYEACTSIMPILCHGAYSSFKPKDIKTILYKNKPVDLLQRKEKENKVTEKDKEKEYRDRLNFWI